MEQKQQKDPLLGNSRFHSPFNSAPGHQNADVFYPKLVIELMMNAVSFDIRQKDRWWEKMCDESIRKTWIQEIREQEEQQDVPDYHRLTDSMLEYLFAELEDHEKIMKQNNGIQTGPYERIWFADNLISPEITDGLVNAVKPLENVPDDTKDWHPGSNEQVLDLVHPSMCPVVYQQTFDTNGKVIEIPKREKFIPEEYHSKRFQWLSADFSVSADGQVRLVSPYINNIHPDHHVAFTPLLENVIQTAAIPLWERVLTGLRWTQPPSRVDAEDCIWTAWQKSLEEKGEWWEPYPSPPEGSEEEDDQVEWQLGLISLMKLPECPKYDSQLCRFYDQENKVSLKGSMMQVIVKLANIILTPDKPEYPGGKWHVEGMNNDRIVSTFIYYYDSTNIEDAQLNFREATREPSYHGQDDSACMRVLYELDRDAICIQDIGSIVTKKGRCLAFPNLYQHQVSPFKLVDNTKPGYRKILVFFLVDPTQIVPSSTNVPARQLEVHKHVLRNPGPNSRLSMLPLELLDHIALLTPGVMNRKEAETIREELTQERTIFRDEVDRKFFGYEFNMCEH